METFQRDLASHDLWDRSLHRSRKRRVLAADGRRTVARQKGASAALMATMIAGPMGSIFAAGASAKSGQGVAAASPANRAIGVAPDLLLSQGSKGPQVAQIQRAVGVAADGFFGSRTEIAVRHYQARNGLAADGIVGARTWTALFGGGTRGASLGAGAPQYRFAVEKADTAEVAKAAPKLEGKGDVAKIELRTVADSPPAEPAAPKKRPARAPEGRGGSEPSTTPAVDTAPSTVSTSCGSDRLIRPIHGGTVTGHFGESRPGHMHAGVDLAAPTGTRIVAAACGVVTQAGWQSGYGNMVCVKHSSSLTTCYAHMSRIGTRVGQTVHQGQLIGYVGSTGNSTGPHVHFETRSNGRQVDPAPYLSGRTRVKTAHSAQASQPTTTRSRTAQAQPSSSAGGSGQASTASTDGQQAQSQQAAPAPVAAQAAPAPVAAAPVAASAPTAPAPVAAAAPAAPVAQQAAPAAVPAAPAAAAPAASEQPAVAAPAEPAAPQPDAAPAAEPAAEAPAAIPEAPATAPAPEAAPAADAPAAPEQSAAAPAVTP